MAQYTRRSFHELSMKLLLSLFFLFYFIICFSQKPKDGTYIYEVAFAEWEGKSLDAKVEVVIDGDSIIVKNYQGLSGKRGDVLDSGIISQHKSGEWIIAHSDADKNFEEIGGCSNGPVMIDFKNGKIWLC